MGVMRNTIKIKILKNSIRLLQTGNYGGICSTFRCVYEISNKVYEEIFEWFQSQKPSDINHSEFTKHPDWKGDTYWWRHTHDETARRQRIRFLEKLIKELKAGLPWYIKIFYWFR